jgi:hypothetical protein
VSRRTAYADGYAAGRRDALGQPVEALIAHVVDGVRKADWPGREAGDMALLDVVADVLCVALREATPGFRARRAGHPGALHLVHQDGDR